MKSILEQEIKRRGISAVDALLDDGPVQVIKNNRPRYVVMSVDAYERMTAGPSAWDWLDKEPDARGYASRTRVEIDSALDEERNAWDKDA